MNVKNFELLGGAFSYETPSMTITFFPEEDAIRTSDPDAGAGWPSGDDGWGGQ